MTATNMLRSVHVLSVNHENNDISSCEFPTRNYAHNGNVKPSHGGHGGYLLASQIVPARPGMVEMAKWVKRLLAVCHPQRHDVLAIGHDDWLGDVSTQAWLSGASSLFRAG